MHRLKRYRSVTNTNLASKSFTFNPASARLKKTVLTAGLYKPNSIRLEHGLMLNALAGALSLAKSQLHGKRQKRTHSMATAFPGDNALPAVDKITHELLPRISDFQSPKFKKPATRNYTLRLNQRFNPLVDFEDLLDAELFDTHRGVFLPVTLHLNLAAHKKYHQLSEHYLRMLRLPLAFYKKHQAPAFDDPATFVAQGTTILHLTENDVT